MSYANKVVKMMESLVKPRKRKLHEQDGEPYVIELSPCEWINSKAMNNEFNKEWSNIDDPAIKDTMETCFSDFKGIVHCINTPRNTRGREIGDKVFNIEIQGVYLEATPEHGRIEANVTFELDNDLSDYDLSHLDPEDDYYEDDVQEHKDELASRMLTVLEDKVDYYFRAYLMGWEGDYNIVADKSDPTKCTFTCDLYF